MSEYLCQYTDYAVGFKTVRSGFQIPARVQFPNRMKNNQTSLYTGGKAKSEWGWQDSESVEI